MRLRSPTHIRAVVSVAAMADTTGTEREEEG